MKAIKALLHSFKIILLFICCTILFYFGLKWLDQNYESYYRYTKPSGGAVKVFQMNQTMHDHGSLNSLLQFLQSGE